MPTSVRCRGPYPADPVSYAGIALLVFDAAFIACYLPARRVLEVDPVAVLRQE